MGSQLVFKHSLDGCVKAIEIPNKELMYNQESRTQSGHLVYGDLGTLFEAELDQSLHKLEMHYQYTVLFDQIRILMNTVPVDLLDYIE